RFSSESLPAYSAIGTHAEKEACHGDLLLAERDGAISIEWDRRAGERNQILRVQLLDREALARHLGVVPRWDAVARAAQRLGPHLTAYPVLEEVLASWRRGAKVRGTGPEDVEAWTYAVAVVSHCRAQVATDVAVRRLSAQLTGDSKRVEQLSAPIDVLIQGEVAAPVRDPEDVFNELGLVKFPPTLLISGALQVRVGAQHVPIDAPYLGFPPSAITGFASCETVAVLLTVENLTTFHELVGQRQHMPAAALLYTGGMPSPSWKRVYRLLLTSLPVEARVFHWGDIDAGGFRIADHLAACAGEVGRRVELHAMSPDVARLDSVSSRRALVDAEVSMIEKLCARWNWDAPARWVSAHRIAVEQESLPASWP
ncbi:MAG: DUF2399 domain-containing protein, partial [Deltaproteobacteria bacterium]|nr:DUF2399 domain-containing protein [Deltaproteobacteria bacterium]